MRRLLRIGGNKRWEEKIISSTILKQSSTFENEEYESKQIAPNITSSSPSHQILINVCKHL